MNTINKTVNEMRNLFNETDVVAMAERLKELEATVLDLQMRLENAENLILNMRAEYRNDKWDQTYTQLGLYNMMGGQN